MRLKFEVLHTSSDTHGRRGRLTLRHGVVETPVFMPVGTQGTIKAVTPDDVERELHPQIILGNTYHLYLRPGAERLREVGGLHKFMRWERNLLTDSGGYQVFSLGHGSQEKKSLVKISEEGALFRSHLDGSKHMLTPEKSIEVQEAIGSDIMMVLDECPPSDATRPYQVASMERTTRWAERCLAARTDAGGALFGIAQGGLDLELREQHLAQLAALPFEGMAIGGLAVGESKEDFLRTLRHIAPLYPADKPRYLMGVGTPEDLVEGVHAGVDMFDCVMPTRNARNGTLFVRSGKLIIKNQPYQKDDRPVDETCACLCCRTYSRSYLRHLFVAGEISYHRLATLHNLTHYLDLMTEVRAALAEGRFSAFRAEWYAQRQAAQQAKRSNP